MLSSGRPSHNLKLKFIYVELSILLLWDQIFKMLSKSYLSLSCFKKYLTFYLVSDPLSSLLPGAGSSLYAEQLRERELRERSALLGLGGLYPPPPEVRGPTDHLRGNNNRFCVQYTQYTCVLKSISVYITRSACVLITGFVYSTHSTHVFFQAPLTT